MKDVNEIKASITRQKANLASLKKYQATQILKANLLKVKKQRIGAVRELLAQVVKKYSHDIFGDQISRLIGEKRYVECIQLIRRSISEMEQEVVKPNVIGTLKKRFTQTENFLEQLLNTHLYRFANNGEFEQGTYEQVIGGLQVLWGDAHMFYSKYQ